MPSSGMQYVQRKLQRSVIETRRSVTRRPKGSIRGSTALSAYATPATVLPGALACGVVALAGPASADDPSRGVAKASNASNTSFVECTTGIVTDGDVQMSALLVTRDAATLPDSTPGECSVR